MTVKHKLSLLGEIPEDWTIVMIKDVCSKIKAGGTPLTSKKEYYNGEIPFVKIEDLTNSSKTLESTSNAITESGLENSSAWLVPPGSILFAMYGSLAETAITKIPVATNQAILGIIPEKKSADAEFLYYLLSRLKPIFERWAKQTTQANLTAKIVRDFKIPFPPFPEQRGIAEVLSCVDEAIQKVDEAIANTERLKKGLMQKLLTEGIGHKEFKETKIGKIPKTWKVVSLGNKNVATLIMGQSPPSTTYNKEEIGLPFLQGKAEFGETYPSPDVYCSKPIKTAQRNDILLSVRAPVGDVNIAPFECCIGRGLSSIRAKSGRLDYRFLFYYLQFTSRRFEALSMGSTFKAIRKREIENYKIPLPSFVEQQKITEILSTIDSKVEFDRRRKVKLERIKRGLMNDLLTGRRRVRIAM